MNVTALNVFRRISEKDVKDSVDDWFARYSRNPKRATLIGKIDGISIVKLGPGYLLLDTDKPAGVIAPDVVHVNGKIIKQVATPHSHLLKEYRGQGLMPKAYHAVFLARGISMLSNDRHTRGANRVWEKLGMKYGWGLVYSDGYSWSDSLTNPVIIDNDVPKSLLDNCRIIIPAKGKTVKYVYKLLGATRVSKEAVQLFNKVKLDSDGAEAFRDFLEEFKKSYKATYYNIKSMDDSEINKALKGKL